MKSNDSTTIFEKICIVISSVLVLLFDVYFSMNVATWNGMHDGIVELWLFLFIAFAVVLTVLLFKKKNLRTKRWFVLFYTYFLVSVIYLVTVAFLFRCPYCNDWSLAKR